MMTSGSDTPMTDAMNARMRLGRRSSKASLDVRNVRLLADQEFPFVDAKGLPSGFAVIVADKCYCESRILQAIALAASGASSAIYLFTQFTSAMTSRRTEAWGGSLARLERATVRRRFAVQSTGRCMGEQRVGAWASRGAAQPPARDPQESCTLGTVTGTETRTCTP